MKPHESQFDHGHLETDPTVVWIPDKRNSPGEKMICGRTAARWKPTGGDSDEEYTGSTTILRIRNKKLRVSLFSKLMTTNYSQVVETQGSTPLIPESITGHDSRTEQSISRLHNMAS
jgi:hypothetical protein